MADLWWAFREGGAPNWIILFFGVVGLGFALASVGLAASRASAARWLGIVTLCCAAVIGGIGTLGVFWNRSRTEDAISGAAIRPTQKQRIRRAGYLESKSCAKFGLGLSALPLLAGAIAALTATKKRGAAAWPNALAPRGLPPGSPVARDGTNGMAFAALGTAGAIAAANVLIIAQRLPGPDLDLYDPLWQVLDAKDLIEAGEMDRGCESLEAMLDQRFRGSIPPEAAAPAAKCVEHRLAAIARLPPPSRRDELANLSRSALLDEPNKRRIGEELARASR